MSRGIGRGAAGVRAFLAGLAGGFGAVLRHLLLRPVTEQYPEEKRALPARSRGRIILTSDAEGDERCVACYLCSAVCPVGCISMQAREREDGRRVAAWFRVNLSRCIYCGFCEEACPTLAIQLTAEFETDRPQILGLVAEKEDMLVDHGGKNREYNYYRHAGVRILFGKGEHPGERRPADIRSNLP